MPILYPQGNKVRYVTLMVTAPGRQRPRRLRVPSLLWKLMFVLPAVLAVCLIWYVAAWFSLSSRNAVLRGENERLRRENARVIALENEVARLSRVAYLLENIAGGGGDESEVRESILDVQNLLGIARPETAAVDSQLPALPAADEIPHRWPVRGQIMADFGTGHSGIDIAAPRGTAVRAAAAGTVSEARCDSVLGFVVAIEHSRGYTTRYGHNSHFVVVPGQRVSAGDVVGFVGASGRTSGPHLHYEVLKDGSPLDPRQFLPHAE